MRLSELVTIYLAVGASFGVSCYLRAQNCARSLTRSVVEGTTAAILWPLAAGAILFGRLRHVYEERATEEPDAPVEEARRAFFVAVNRMLDVARSSRWTKRKEIERTLYALRESAEQYVALSEVEATADREASPARYEMELARISGRRGDDLLIAGRCTHRRNVSRIKARYERERSRMLDALSELSMEESNSPASYLEETDTAERRLMYEARLEVYGRAGDLFSLIKDAGAVKSAARLLYGEACGLRRLQESDADAGQRSAHGEERCIEDRPQLIYKDRPRETTFTTG